MNGPNLSQLSWLQVFRDGDDLLIPLAHATWFGGDSDPEDDGETSSGVLTKGNPSLMGCALPLSGYGVRSLNGSPLPRMPFGLHSNGAPNPSGCWADVAANGVTLSLPCIDLGPSLSTRHGIDLTVAAFKHLSGSLSRGVVDVSVRIKNAALHL
jgi:hypothetical protein